MAKGRTAAIDTCALSFYQQGRIEGASLADRERADRIAYYMESVLAEDEGRVVLPAICLGEYLAQYGDDQRNAVKDGIEDNFMVVEYGIAAALEFAKLRHDKEAFNESRKKSGRPAQCVKVDSLIAATALGEGALEILTDNSRDFASLCRDRLTPVLVNDLPARPPAPPPRIQPPLPGIEAAG